MNECENSYKQYRLQNGAHFAFWPKLNVFNDHRCFMTFIVEIHNIVVIKCILGKYMNLTHC